MKFEDEIKQSKPFKSEGIKAMLNIMYTASHFQERSVRLLKPYHINEQHYNILRILRGRRGKPASPKEIKRVLLNSRGDLTRLIDKLVNLKLVDRFQSAADRRVVELTITEKGASLTENIEREFEASGVYKFGLSESDAKQLNNLLDKIRE